MKILIKTPRKPHNKWQLSINGAGHLFRQRAEVIFRAVEKRLLALSETSKIDLLVGYGHSYRNNGNYFVKEALFALQAFLEDYLPTKFRRAREKKYCPIIESIL